MKNFIYKKNTLLTFAIIAAIMFTAPSVLAVWSGTFYRPGDTLNPECLPTDANCDVATGLSVAAGKTLTASNTLTLTATDGSTLAIGSGGTLGTNAYTSAAYAPLASPSFTTQIISPLIMGGTATTSDLTLQTTSGVGATGADMHFLVGNNGAIEAMTILNSGNVGIGTANPSGILHTQKLANDANHIFDVYSDNNGHVPRLKFRRSFQDTVGFTANTTNSYLGSFEFYGVNSGSTNWARGAEIRAQQVGSAGAADLPAKLLFLTSDGASNQVERLVIDNLGNVGIGTTSPGTKLEIGSSDLGDGAAGPIITLGRNTNATNTGAGSINFLGKTGTAGYVWQDAAGNMRINTAAPTNANDVAGTVIGAQTSIRESKQDINDYTDYTGALSMVLNAPLHTFRYINEVNGYGENSPLTKIRIGYIADEVNPMFMVGNSIDQVSVNGLLMASVKELDLKIKDISPLHDSSVFDSVITKFKDVYGAVWENSLLKVANIISDKLTTKELCLEEVCVTKTQLKELLEKNNISNVSGASATNIPADTSIPATTDTTTSSVHDTTGADTTTTNVDTFSADTTTAPVDITISTLESAPESAP